MRNLLRARLSTQIPQPELSKMWESERTTFTTGTGDGIETWLTAPEIVIETQGPEVSLRFESGDDAYGKVKAAFERAVHRYQPEVRIDWLD